MHINNILLVGEQGTTDNTLITWLMEEAIICGNVMF
jgi:hypothetical protein